MPLLSRKKLLMAELETTYGTDPTPTASANAIEVRNIEITPLEVETVSRELVRPFLGQADQLLANEKVLINCEVEFVGSGAAGTAPAYGPLLQACRCTETIVSSTSATYAPNSDATPKSVTIYFNVDGVQHKATGCRGTFTLNCEVGQIPFISFEMTGIYVEPSDVALATPTYANQADPLVFKNGNTSSFQVFSYNAALQSLNFELANEVIYRELVGGTKSVDLIDRAPSGECVIEAPTIAQKDFFTAARNSSTGNLTFQHGTAAGNIVTFSANQIDLSGPTYSDQDGIQMLNLGYIATPSSAGNDDFSLVYT